MKKLFAIICAVILLGSLPANVYASTQEESITAMVVSETTEYFQDGTYATIVVTEEPTLARATTITGSKTYTLRNSDGDILWQFIEKGTFSVNSGVSATCTAASHTIKIVNTNWKNTSATSKKSGNQAIGDGTFERKLLGLITTDSGSCHVVLTCDKNGNLS